MKKPRPFHRKFTREFARLRAFVAALTFATDEARRSKTP